jgi:predicted alpha/beta hydrolase family esterase
MLGLYLNSLTWIAPRKAGHRGFLLFCRPMRMPLNQKQKEFFNTADKFTLEFDDTPIQGYRWGRGPKKILFLHGWQSHTYRWKAYIDALSKEEYTIYSIDAPGHGLSGGNFLSVPVYGKLIQQLVLELGSMHTIVGHSLGSFSLLYTLHQYPLLPVRKIILMAPPGEASDFMRFYRDTLRLSRRTMKYIIDHFITMYDVGPEYFSTSRFAASVNVSGLIIHDEGDLEAPYQYATQIHHSWKRSRLMTTRGLGHNLKSTQVVNEVLNFVEEQGVAERTWEQPTV